VAEGDHVKVTFDITDGDGQDPRRRGRWSWPARSPPTATSSWRRSTTPATPRSADNASIPIARTRRRPVEWDEILAALDKFTNGLSRADGKAGALSNLLTVGAKSLSTARVPRPTRR
jgi:hypothetical protein